MNWYRDNIIEDGDNNWSRMTLPGNVNPENRKNRSQLEFVRRIFDKEYGYTDKDAKYLPSSGSVRLMMANKTHNRFDTNLLKIFTDWKNGDDNSLFLARKYLLKRGRTPRFFIEEIINKDKESPDPYVKIKTSSTCILGFYNICNSGEIQKDSLDSHGKLFDLYNSWKEDGNFYFIDEARQVILSEMRNPTIFADIICKKIKRSPRYIQRFYQDVGDSPFTKKDTTVFNQDLRDLYLDWKQTGDLEGIKEAIIFFQNNLEGHDETRGRFKYTFTKVEFCKKVAEDPRLKTFNLDGDKIRITYPVVISEFHQSFIENNFDEAIIQKARDFIYEMQLKKMPMPLDTEAKKPRDSAIETIFNDVIFLCRLPAMYWGKPITDIPMFSNLFNKIKSTAKSFFENTISPNSYQGLGSNENTGMPSPDFLMNDGSIFEVIAYFGEHYDLRSKFKIEKLPFLLPENVKFMYVSLKNIRYSLMFVCETLDNEVHKISPNGKQETGGLFNFSIVEEIIKLKETLSKYGLELSKDYRKFLFMLEKDDRNQLTEEILKMPQKTAQSQYVPITMEKIEKELISSGLSSINYWTDEEKIAVYFDTIENLQNEIDKIKSYLNQQNFQIEQPVQQVQEEIPLEKAALNWYYNFKVS